MGDPVRFPEGMPAFIQKLHDMGFKFGLYTDIGPHGCHHPFTGSFPLYAQDAATFKEWQVDYVKFDGCDLPTGYTPEELTCNMSQALLDTGDDFWFNFHCWHTETCAKCGTSFRVGPDHHDNWDSTSGIIDLLQTRQDWWGPDPDYGWPDPDFIYTGGQGCNSTDPGPDHGNPGPSPPGKRCPGQTDDEYVSEYSIWALAGGEIIVSSDPRNMSALQKYLWLNEEVIAMYQDVSGFRDVKMVGNGSAVLITDDGCALEQKLSSAACVEGKTFGCFEQNQSMWTSDGCRGVFTCSGQTSVICDAMDSKWQVCKCVPGKVPPGPTPHSKGPQVWVRPTSDGGAAVALFNGNDLLNASITVDFADVTSRSWSSTTKLNVRNMWERQSLGSATGSYTATVRPHFTVLLKLTPAQ
mmetsp:Transcript_63206/g.87866  ORF Transcript_63206/g.87866 Transcript_63206/m.87866 type:complete len:410 (-) Transcript_63206:19-1248(-)